MCLSDLSPHPGPLEFLPALSIEQLKIAYCTQPSKVSLSPLRSSLRSFSTSASLETQQPQQFPSPSSTLTVTCSYSPGTPTQSSSWIPTWKQRELLPMAGNPSSPDPLTICTLSFLYTFVQILDDDRGRSRRGTMSASHYRQCWRKWVLSVALRMHANCSWNSFQNCSYASRLGPDLWLAGISTCWLQMSNRCLCSQAGPADAVYLMTFWFSYDCMYTCIQLQSLLHIVLITNCILHVRTWTGRCCVPDDLFIFIIVHMCSLSYSWFGTVYICATYCYYLD